VTAFPAPTALYVAQYGAETDKWVAGFCMLRCCRNDVFVTQVGDVANDGSHMPLFSCWDCMQEMAMLLQTWTRVRDGLVDSNAVYELNDRLVNRHRAA
jgi:hypothetical protein